MTTYQLGEIVDITIKGVRVTEVATAADGHLVMAAETGLVGLNVYPDDPAVTVTRVAPPDWPPRPGDLWRDGHRSLWFTSRRTEGLGWRDVFLPAFDDNATIVIFAVDALRELPGLTLVHREPEAGERS